MVEYDKYFCNINTAEKAYFLGLLAADGFICKSEGAKKSTYCCGVSASTRDSETIIAFARASGFHIRERQYFDKRPGKETTYQQMVAECRTKYCYALLVSIFGGSRKADRCFPDIPFSFIPDFVRGVYDGDGSLSRYKDGSWELSISSSEKLLQPILPLIGLQSKLYADKGAKRIRIRKKTDISAFTKFIYHEQGVMCLQRKYEKAMMFASSK